MWWRPGCSVRRHLLPGFFLPAINPGFCEINGHPQLAIASRFLHSQFDLERSNSLMVFPRHRHRYSLSSMDEVTYVPPCFSIWSIHCPSPGTATFHPGYQGLPVSLIITSQPEALYSLRSSLRTLPSQLFIQTVPAVLWSQCPGRRL